LKAQALRRSLNQGNREEKFPGKFGKRELLAFLLGTIALVVIC
jgi:hypothetical protein